MRRLLPALAAALLAALVAAAPAPAAYERLIAPTSKCGPQTDGTAPRAAQEAAMRCLVNFARRKTGAPAATQRGRLMRSANRKAADILSCEAFSHTACGRAFQFHVQRIGYAAGCHGVGENLAWGSGSYGTVRSIFRSWLNSTAHRRNLLSAKYRDHGVGLVTGSMGGRSGAAVWVHHLGYHC